MRLGILVVYLVRDGMEWVLDKHLEHLAATEPYMDFTVYAATTRLEPKYLSKLQKYPFIKIISLPRLDCRSSAEHGTYLDMLAAHAIADGCDYVCTFDVDSWPICPDWIERAYRLVEHAECPAAAVLRAENGDAVLPHPLFSFLHRSLFASPDCKYWLPDQDRQDFVQFLRRHKQLGDTGIGIGFFLANAGIDWVKILRSNRTDLHYLMGGIYGDFVFHFGASSRDDLVFRGDDIKWLVAPAEALGRLTSSWTLKRLALRGAKRLYAPAAKRRNKRAFDEIVARLRADEIGLYDHLRASSASAVGKLTSSDRGVTATARSVP